MDTHHRRLVDHTLPALAEGYAWLPNRMRRGAGQVVRTRLMGRPTLAVRGPEAVEFFYDEKHVRRHDAILGPVLSTLFGHAAVHTLDGDAHSGRKELFLPLLHVDRIAGVVEQVTAAWDEAVATWAGRSPVVLFDEASVVLTRGVCRWAGIPLNDEDAEPPARDLVAMVDGFATPGPRHWRARRARVRQKARLARLVEDVRSGALTAPDIVVGPVIISEARMLAVPSKHPLSGRTAVVMEDLADIPLLRLAGALPGDWPSDRWPEHTPDGRIIRSGPRFETFQEALQLIGTGSGGMIVGAQVTRFYGRPDITYVPFSDAPPVDWAPVWLKSSTTPLVRAFARTAREAADQVHRGS